MKRNILSALIPVILILAAAGCGTPPATAPVSESEAAPIQVDATSSPSTSTSSTPDPCSLPQLEVEVQEVHGHMREFDDAAILASNVPREQLSTSIADLQRIRREAEDEPIPACLTQLKAYQVDHMNTVISTLVAFMGGTDQQTLDRGITRAREQHDQYTLELARVLGLTVVAVTPASAPSATATP